MPESLPPLFGRPLHDDADEPSWFHRLESTLSNPDLFDAVGIEPLQVWPAEEAVVTARVHKPLIRLERTDPGSSSEAA